MRKKVQNDASCYAQFLAQKKSFREIAEAFSFRDDDQFIDAAALEDRPNLRLWENSDEFGSPFSMLFDHSGKIVSTLAAADYSHMTDVEGRVFVEAKQDEPIGHQEHVVDCQGQQHHGAIRYVPPEEENGCHDET